MSFSYNAVVLAAERTALIRQLKHLTEDSSMFFQAFRIARGRFVVFGWNREDRKWRWEPWHAEEFEDLAKKLSRKFIKAVAVHFMDDVMDCRHATFYRRGKLIRKFDEEDELYALADSEGNALPDAPWCPWKDIPESERFAFVWDGIDAALEAAGFGGLFPSAGLWYECWEDLIWEYQGDAYHLWTDQERHRGLNLGYRGDVRRAFDEIRDLCSGEDHFRILVEMSNYAVLLAEMRTYAVGETDVPPDVFTQAQEAGRRFLCKYKKDKRFSEDAIGMVRHIVEHKPQFKRRRGKLKRRKQRRA